MILLLLVPISGAFLLSLVIFQVLLGKRVIRFKGKLHMRVHSWTAYALIGLAVLHGLYGTHIFFGWPF